jgi:D-aminopeptidase
MRARAYGLAVGLLEPGPANAITDVAGVRVGHASHRDDHVGVTCVLPCDGDPWHEPFLCATAALNGAGELAGKAQIDEWGLAETPVFLTATPYVGAVYAAATRILTAREPRLGRDDVVIPVVAECDPSAWCDVRSGPEPDDGLVAAALDGAAAAAAGHPVVEGQVGAGIGMESFGFAAGIGTASRVAESGHVVGVLVLANFGDAARLTVCGRALGLELAAAAGPHGDGSCVCLVATDAPLVPHQLARLARRPFLGLARCGSTGANGSGEIALAWTTRNRPRRDDERDERAAAILAERRLSSLFAAASEAAEEAVLNALCAGRRLTGYDGSTLPAFPAERAAES